MSELVQAQEDEASTTHDNGGLECKSKPEKSREEERI